MIQNSKNKKKFPFKKRRKKLKNRKKKEIMTIFKLIFFISLITNAFDCQKDNACQWDDEVIQKCSPITNVLTTECDANKATEDA